MARAEFLNQDRPLPQAGSGNIVQWHVYRTQREARNHVADVMLGEGQHLTGGHSLDSIGDLWWVGVQVDDLKRWGNRSAINKHAE